MGQYLFSSGRVCTILHTLIYLAEHMFCTCEIIMAILGHLLR